MLLSAFHRIITHRNLIKIFVEVMCNGCLLENIFMLKKKKNEKEKKNRLQHISDSLRMNKTTPETKKCDD